jgi:hypothetical protein
MFRRPGSCPDPPLDAATLERLLSGGAIDDLPDAYRALGCSLAAAAAPACADELAGEAAAEAAAAFVAAREVDPLRARRRRGRTRGNTLVVSTLGVLFVVGASGSVVAATRGNLPEPVQEVAHQTLGAVGITVPGITDDVSGPAHHIDVETATPPAFGPRPAHAGGHDGTSDAGASAATNDPAADPAAPEPSADPVPVVADPPDSLPDDITRGPSDPTAAPGTDHGTDGAGPGTGGGKAPKGAKAKKG